MARIKRRWVPAISYSIGGVGSATFLGRNSQLIQGKLKIALLRLGVFKERPDGTIFYSAPVKIQNQDNSYEWVQEDGTVQYDPAMLHDKYRDVAGLPTMIEKDMSES